mgnify:CR=1 FL=1
MTKRAAIFPWGFLSLPPGAAYFPHIKNFWLRRARSRAALACRGAGAGATPHPLPFPSPVDKSGRRRGVRMRAGGDLLNGRNDPLSAKGGTVSMDTGTIDQPSLIPIGRAKTKHASGPRRKATALTATYKPFPKGVQWAFSGFHTLSSGVQPDIQRRLNARWTGKSPEVAKNNRSLQGRMGDVGPRLRPAPPSHSLFAPSALNGASRPHNQPPGFQWKRT